MFDSDDREQNELDYQYVLDLRKALAKAIAEADGWHDECRDGKAPGLDKERALLRVNMVDEL